MESNPPTFDTDRHAQRLTRRALLRLAALAGAGHALGSFGCGGDGHAAGSGGADDAAIDALLAELSVAEKATLVSGGALTLANFVNTVLAYNTRPVVSGELPERGLEGIRFTDGPRGVVMNHSTSFPVSMARGATWDPELEARVGDAIGVEARTEGATVFAGVCVNLLRHPAWGRAQECYGEDPVLTAAMGVALLGGVQRHLMACVKHFACNSIEDSRFYVDVQIDERALHEVYLPHFKACVDAGAAAVMSAYNKLNGAYCGQNPTLLTAILKDEWRFDGFVLSDFIFGIRDGVAAMNAGLDLEMPLALQFGDKLVRAVEDGRVARTRLDDACRRLLRQQHRFAAVGEPQRYRPEMVAGPEHQALAREVAVEAMVLLRNEPPQGSAAPLLPLMSANLRRVAMVGRLADAPNLGDSGSSEVRPPYAVSPLAGIREALPNADIVAVPSSTLAGYEDAVAAADAVIAVVGYTHDDEGENLVVGGGDRHSLTLRPEDEALLLEASRLNPRTVAVVIAGSAIVSEAWRESIPSILVAWYPGMEGGRALAAVLLGERSPGGKLPCVFPRSAADLPAFDPAGDSAVYDRYHGYRLLDRNGVEPAFAFGHGLSYTTFELSAPAVAASRVRTRDALRITVTVTNTGGRAGSEVVQVYVEPPRSDVDRPVRELRGFRKVRVDSGASATVEIDVPVDKLGYWDVERHAIVVAKGEYVAHVGTSSRLADLQPIAFTVV